MENRQIMTLAYMFVAVIMVALIANAVAGEKNTQKVYDFDQFDSLCVADDIPRDLGTWEKRDVYDEEKEKVITIFSIDKGDSVSYEITFGDNGDFNVLKNKR